MDFAFPQHEQLAHIEQSDNPSTFPYSSVPVDKGACRLLGPTALVRMVCVRAFAQGSDLCLLFLLCHSR
jgi:hypothetical protein